MVFCVAINCTNNSKSKVSTFKFPQDPKLKKQWLLKLKRECFTPSKHSRICAAHFSEDSFQQNLRVRSLLGPSFKPRRLVLKKDAVPTIFNFTVEPCKQATGQKRRKTSEECLPNSKNRTSRSTVRSAFAKRRKLEVMFALFNIPMTSLTSLFLVVELA